MRIVIDGRMLYWTGVGRYTKALLDNLEQIDDQNEYVVLVRRADWDLWEPQAKNFRKVEANIDPYTLDEQLKLPGLVRGLEPDVVHFTAPNTPLLYRGKRVVTVHDLTLLDYDTSRGTGVRKALRGLKRLPFRLLVWNNALTATAITSDTQFVKDRLVKRFGARKDRVTVAHLAVDENLAKPESLEKFRDLGDYLLTVGNFYPYKNVGATIRALKLLEGKRPELKLVIVGKPDFFRDELEAEAARLGLSERVVFTGFVTDGELVSLYQGAKLYVYPSLSEGFGLQGFEAMSQALPVLSSSASCLPEVYGDAAVYFDPHNPEDQAGKIEDLLRHDGLREKMVKAGHERIKQFSWKKMAEETLEVYRRAAR